VKAAVALALLCAGCALPPPAPIVHQPLTVRPPDAARRGAPADGAIYRSDGMQKPLFEDVRARNVGDTLLIVINESTSAGKKGSSSIDRSADVGAEIGPMSKVPGKSFQNLSVSASSSNSFDGSGATANSNTFAGTITVTVIEVLANGNLLVSGEKQIAISEGTEYIRFSGVVNPRAITATNTVSSTQVADARIEYKANGTLNEAQRMGWLARFFMSILPF
jgi:flagellar L-ring protein FlgH